MHIGLLSAGLMMPRAVGLRPQLTVLPAFIRQLFWIYYTFIGLCLVSFGSITIFLASALAGGSNLARALYLSLAALWLVRLVAATFVFDVRPYLTNRWWRLGYHATNIVFIYLPIVYLLAAWKGGAA